MGMQLRHQSWMPGGCRRGSNCCVKLCRRSVTIEFPPMIRTILKIIILYLILNCLITDYRIYNIEYYDIPAITVKHKEIAKVDKITGVASWYDYSLDGIVYSKDHATCASRRYKRGSMVNVVNIENGKSIICRVNDYGPEAWTNREIDLSSHAFSQIAPLSKGVVKVEVNLLK